MLKVKNMINERGNTIPNQFIITDDNTVTFQSYDSTIATINRSNNTITIYPDYNFSRTTGKYRNMFFSDYGLYELANLQGLEKAIKTGYCNDYQIFTIIKVAA